MGDLSYQATGFQMINSIEIRNFRCFGRLDIEGCRRVNVIVGDNGAGKTALLEAVFLALGAHPDIATRYRQQRGFDGSFNGSPRAIEEALWGGLFSHGDTSKTASVVLAGDGDDSRAVFIARGGDDVLLPAIEAAADTQLSRQAPLTFTWRDASSHFHAYPVLLSSSGPQVRTADEDMPDYFYFASTHPISATETATRFSALSRVGKIDEFKNVFRQLYSWIEDFSIEVVAGQPIIFATIEGGKEKLAINDISSALTKIVNILLCIASRPRSVVLIDEIENGIYHTHLTALWENVINFARRFDSQLFVSTHSDECLQALIDAADRDVDDIELWRLERSPQQPTLRRFGGATFRAGAKSSGELR